MKHTNTSEAPLEVFHPSKRLWIAIVLGSLSAIAPLSIDMYLPALPMLTENLLTTTSLAQLSLTACLLGIALGQIFVGPLSDSRGRKRPLIISLIIYGLSSVLCALAPSIWILIILRFIQGAAGSAGIVISRAVVRDLYSGSEMTRFFSLLMLVNGVAPILAPVFGGQLLQVTTWHGVFLVLGLISGAMLLGVITILPETLSKDNRTSGHIMETLTTYRTLISDRVFMGYALSQGFIMAAMFAYISGSPFVLQDIFGVSPQIFSLCFAINGLGIILASQITGRLAGKIKEERLLEGGLSIAGFGGMLLLLMTVLESGIAGILISLFMVVSSVGIVSTAGFSLAMQNHGRSAGSASALMGLLPFIFGAFVAPLVGIAGSHTALPMGIIIALCEILAIGCYYFLARRK